MSDPNQPVDSSIPPAPPAPPPTQPPGPPAPPAPPAALASVPGIPIVLTPIDPPAQAPFARPAPSPYEQDAYPPFAEQPCARSSRRRWLIGGGVAAGVIVLLGAGAVVGAIAMSGAHSADRPVAAFLQNLVDGEAEAALALLNDADEGPLLTDEVYGAAENRISGFTLGEPTVEGDTATVVATVTQGDEEYETTFALESAGMTLLFWNDWRMAALPLADVAVDFDAPSDLALEVGGSALDRALVDEGPVSALPGDYAFSSPDDNVNYTAASATASVVGFGGRAGVDPIDPVDVAFPVTLTAAGETAALAAANAVLDVCAAQTVMAPAGCGFGIRIEPGTENTNIRWTVTTRPTATFGAWDGGGFPVLPETSGRLDFASDITEPATGRRGTASATKDNYEFEGTVTFVDGAAEYESLDSVIGRLQDIIEGSEA